MNKVSHQEVYWIGFEDQTSSPYFWIRTSEWHVTHTLQVLQKSSRDWPTLREYLGHGSELQLDHYGRFGFGRVGTMDELGDDDVILRVYLRGRAYNRRVLLTLRVILDALNQHRHTNGYELQTINQQVLELEPGISNSPKGHGISGTIYPAAKALLTEQAVTRSLSAICTAMQWAWKHTADPEYRPYFAECGLYLHSDGRPELTCFGFGVTSGIGPQSVLDECWPISSDNADAPEHGLTLLAGWCKLSHTLRQRLHGFP